MQRFLDVYTNKKHKTYVGVLGKTIYGFRRFYPIKCNSFLTNHGIYNLYFRPCMFRYNRTHRWIVNTL